MILKWPGRGETPRPTHPVYIWNIPIIPSTRLGGRLLLLFHGDAERQVETPNLGDVHGLMDGLEFEQIGLFAGPRRERPAIRWSLVSILPTVHCHGVGLTKPHAGKLTKDYPVVQL
ncbi:MAG: hypothetical protein KAJ15_10815 [Spirochaetes bacterium]|nr:hypothetical protein [Spirochaetota bacterium]